MEKANAVKNEDSPVYLVHTLPTQAPVEDAVIAHALDILKSRMRTPGNIMNSPREIKSYLSLTLAQREHEVFVVLFLDAQHRLIESEELFRGTLTQTSVYPREVVKRALFHNAAAVVLAHNHPSGNITESSSDVMLTGALKSALSLVDVRVLDHMIVAGMNISSFAEKGLI